MSANHASVCCAYVFCYSHQINILFAFNSSVKVDCQISTFVSNVQFILLSLAQVLLDSHSK